MKSKLIFFNSMLGVLAGYYILILAIYFGRYNGLNALLFLSDAAFMSLIYIIKRGRE